MINQNNKYDIELTITENKYSDPIVYKMLTKQYPYFENIKNLIYQAIEIEGLDNSSFICEYVISRIDGKDCEFINHEEFEAIPVIVRTKEPSKFIKWESKAPHIFAIDRLASKLILVF